MHADQDIIYAYSTIQIKALDGGAGAKRRFVGVASTPSVDRDGDIVEPDGATYKLPLPLVWQHNTREPIGWVTSAKVSKEGITVECEVASAPEPQTLKDRLDEAWQTIKIGMVRGLSIGFKPLESQRIEGTYSRRYTKWQWLELSPVTIPANSECSINIIKALDRDAIRRAALGASAVRQVVRLDGLAQQRQPGVSGLKQRRNGVVYLD